MTSVPSSLIRRFRKVYIVICVQHHGENHKDGSRYEDSFTQWGTGPVLGIYHMPILRVIGIVCGAGNQTRLSNQESRPWWNKIDNGPGSVTTGSQWSAKAHALCDTHEKSLAGELKQESPSSIARRNIRIINTVAYIVISDISNYFTGAPTPFGGDGEAEGSEAENHHKDVH